MFHEPGEAEMDDGIVARTGVPASAWPQLSWAAHIAAAWAVAGGAAGGMLVAVLLLTGRIPPHNSVTVALVLGTLGSMLGVVHGAVLGYLGRHAGEDMHPRIRDRIFALVVAACALLASLAIAVWIAMAAALARSGNTWGLLALAAGAAVVLAIAIWATLLGWDSLEVAYLEWPEHRLGARLLGGSFAVLCVVFLAMRPDIPGTQIQLSPVGWMVVAALATIWIATPAIVLVLRGRGEPVQRDRGGAVMQGQAGGENIAP
jgi:hypothetical protein